MSAGTKVGSKKAGRDGWKRFQIKELSGSLAQGYRLAVIALAVFTSIAAFAVVGFSEVYLEELNYEEGFNVYSWHNQDFFWKHTLPSQIANAVIEKVTLFIEAYDVDSPYEVDLVYAGKQLLGELIGRNRTVEMTEFTIEDLKALLSGNELEIFLDIDSTHDRRCWAVTILRSILEVEYSIIAQVEQTPRVRIESVNVPAGGGGATGTPGDVVEVTLINAGNADYVGPCDIKIGLSYDKNWMPEWCTIFDTHQIGIVEIAAGETKTVSFNLASLPEGAVKEFRERLNTWWTSYQDRDPETDFIAFVAKFEGLPDVIDYAPLP